MHVPICALCRVYVHALSGYGGCVCTYMPLVNAVWVIMAYFSVHRNEIGSQILLTDAHGLCVMCSMWAYVVCIMDGVYAHGTCLRRLMGLVCTCLMFKQWVMCIHVPYVLSFMVCMRLCIIDGCYGV
jgi:hypothetical protein